MIKHIQIIPLIIGLVVGIIAVLCVNPDKDVIRQYPHPDNVDKLVYKDNNGVCYRYLANKVDCDKNESKLKDFPLSK
jgi:hypothetical protein